MSPESTNPGKFRKRLLSNFGLKLVSLLIAVLLWLAISSAPLTEIAFSVPVEFRNVSDGVEVTSENIPQAEVRVRGPIRVVRELKPSDIHVVLDMADVSLSPTGERTFDLNARLVRVPAGVEVVQVVPSYMRLSFDKRGSRRLEVRARVVGSFPPGYKISSVTVEPASVTVIGPEKHLKAMEAAMTDLIDASGVMGKQTFLATAHVEDPLVRFTDAAAVRVTVVTEKTK